MASATQVDADDLDDVRGRRGKEAGEEEGRPSSPMDPWEVSEREEEEEEEDEEDFNLSRNDAATREGPRGRRERISSSFGSSTNKRRRSPHAA